jgi:hypothetical protein
VDERTDRRTRAHPIRDVLRERGQGQSWLARKLGIEPGYARGMIAGSFRVSDRLRTGASLLLGLPEDALFHPDASSASAPEISDDADSHAGTVAGAALYPIGEEGRIVRIA